MKTELRNKVAMACQYLLQNFDHEFMDKGIGGSQDDVHATRSQRRHRGDMFYSDGESSFGESSLNQV